MRFTMKNGRFSDVQIVAVLKRHAGLWALPRAEMGSARFYKWRAKFGGMHCTAGYRAAMFRGWTRHSLIREVKDTWLEP